MKFVDHAFEDERVILDGNTFERCVFQRCTLVFTGIVGAQFVAIDARESTWVFEGAALNTLRFMQALYHGGAAAAIEVHIEELRKPPPPKQARH